MKIAYFDCIAGVSGDMLLGALVDAGLPVENLRGKLAGLNLGNEFELKAYQVSKNGFGATKMDVLVQEHQPGRHLAEMEAILHKSSLRTTSRRRRSASSDAWPKWKPASTDNRSSRCICTSWAAWIRWWMWSGRW